MTKKIILDIDDKLWEDFKRIVTRDKNLNQAVVELIEGEVRENIDQKLMNMNFERGLEILREEVDTITEELINLVFRRMLIVEKMGKLKKKFEKPIEDKLRESEIMDNIKKIIDKENRKLGKDLVDYKTLQNIMKLLISDAKIILSKIKEEG